MKQCPARQRDRDNPTATWACQGPEADHVHELPPNATAVAPWFLPGEEVPAGFADLVAGLQQADEEVARGR